MKSMVVLFALAAVACGSLVPVAQPPHHPAIILDPHGRPLDTAEVINNRAVHLQAKALEGHHVPLVHAAPIAHSVVAPAVIGTSVWGAHAGLASPLLGHAAHGFGHWLKKRSLGHLAYSAPIIAPSAVSHQSRVDVISSPAVVSHAVAAPVVSHAVAAPLVAHVAPAAVSHQSRVDVRTSPAVVSHSVVAAPVVAAHSAWAAPAVSAHGLGLGLSHGWGLSHGHLLKKRSLGLAHGLWGHAIAPSAVSHQSRVDVISSPAVVAHAAPLAVAHAAPLAVAHAAPVAVAHSVPVAHSTVLTAPAAHLTHPGLLHASPLVHAAHW